MDEFDAVKISAVVEKVFSSASTWFEIYEEANEPMNCCMQHAGESFIAYETMKKIRGWDNLQYILVHEMDMHKITINVRCYWNTCLILRKLCLHNRIVWVH